MNKTKICDSTFNPITGCLHGCQHCYARGIVNRFGGYSEDIGQTKYGDPYIVTYRNGNKINHVLEEPLMITRGEEYDWCVAPYPFMFDPTFHRYLLNRPSKMKKPRTIFVGSMTDMFGEWVPEDWLRQVFNACAAAPQHRYIFLTKDPENMKRVTGTRWWCDFQNSLGFEHEKPYYGTSVACGDDLNRVPCLPRAVNRFVSIEPLLSALPWDLLTYALKSAFVKWVIIGAETGNRKGKIIPKREWVENIVNVCREQGIPIFMKESLSEIWGKELIQKFPWEVGK